MISFHYEVDFRLRDETRYSDWISRVIESEGKKLGELSYVFCSDRYLLEINQKYLGHDTYTDIITFDYCEAFSMSGDFFISVERVKENASELAIAFEEELRRVMVHGVLHLLGYDDKKKKDQAVMRRKEDEKIEMFHVER
ncbi:rRNA maturation RNase YbeY [Flavobacteriaceae bacterium TP-CH-4]|uniref:Endoribonuclease YbeY n=1 Tax=Pelagihabitans pacificus TaxID=2696054 RepID=A0A967E5Y1_9FLAO|nr:rRNA maturation RNase YbeY [Pelagihabitans pacificus]NHF59055.1 rRNA maturation RNase YbeY [Pelagihabitans pacificus]